jgi:hypothetical protein
MSLQAVFRADRHDDHGIVVYVEERVFVLDGIDSAQTTNEPCLRQNANECRVACDTHLHVLT